MPCGSNDAATVLNSAWLPVRRSASPRPREQSQPAAARTSRTFSSAPQVRARATSCGAGPVTRAIARAIASRPRLLILDEANGSFDYESDQALGQGLLSLKGQTTIVIITNRPSFAAIADRLFTLVDGKFCQLEQRKPPMKGDGRPQEAVA